MSVEHTPPPGSSLNHLVLREAQPLDGMIPTPPHFELPNGNSGGSNINVPLNSPFMGELIKTQRSTLTTEL